MYSIGTDRYTALFAFFRWGGKGEWTHDNACHALSPLTMLAPETKANTACLRRLRQRFATITPAVIIANHNYSSTIVSIARCCTKTELSRGSLDLHSEIAKNVAHSAGVAVYSKNASTDLDVRAAHIQKRHATHARGTSCVRVTYIYICLTTDIKPIITHS